MECKLAIPKDVSINKIEYTQPDTANSRKIFVGGLHHNVTESELKEYFIKFGPIDQCVIIYEKNTGRSRGFGFIIFNKQESVDLVINDIDKHFILGKWVECKRATPKETAQDNLGNKIEYSRNQTYPSIVVNNYCKAYILINLDFNNSNFNQNITNTIQPTIDINKDRYSNCINSKVYLSQNNHVNNNLFSDKPLFNHEQQINLNNNIFNYFRYKFSDYKGEDLISLSKLTTYENLNNIKLFQDNYIEKLKYDKVNENDTIFSSVDKFNMKKEEIESVNCYGLSRNKPHVIDRKFKPY